MNFYIPFTPFPVGGTGRQVVIHSQRQADLNAPLVGNACRVTGNEKRACSHGSGTELEVPAAVNHVKLDRKRGLITVARWTILVETTRTDGTTERVEIVVLDRDRPTVALCRDATLKRAGPHAQRQRSTIGNNGVICEVQLSCFASPVWVRNGPATLDSIPQAHARRLNNPARESRRSGCTPPILSVCTLFMGGRGRSLAWSRRARQAQLVGFCNYACAE